MTPTEQDKELRQKMQDIFNDCTSGWLITIKNFNGYERELGDMESEIIGDILELITADRKRVALGARRSEALIADRNLGQYPDYHKMKTASLKRIDDIESGLFISVHDLKAQQEEVR